MTKDKTLTHWLQENEADFEKYLTMFAVAQLLVYADSCPLFDMTMDIMNCGISQTVG